MGHDLVVLGDLVADLIVPIEQLPLYPEKHGWADGIFIEPGGAGNVLVAARRMNLNTATLAPLGDDHYGGEVLKMLQREGVDTSHAVAHTGRPTILCMVLTDKQGQHVFLAIQDDFGPWPFPCSWHDVIRNGRALYTDGYSLAHFLDPVDVIAACRTAREAGVPVFFDSSPSIHFVAEEIRQQAFAGIDVFFINNDEAASITEGRRREDAARALLDVGVPKIVLKLGGEGCLVATTDEITHVPGFPVDVVDTVGAGDSFAAAFIAGWLRGGSPTQCARLANAMGALTSTQRGAGTRIPQSERLQSMLAGEPEVAALIEG